MTREEAKALLPIIQAYAEGKTIQMQTPQAWENVVTEIQFDLEPQFYRIKPEPREWWITVDAGCPDLAFTCRDDATERSQRVTSEIVRVREVIA